MTNTYNHKFKFKPGDRVKNSHDEWTIRDLRYDQPAGPAYYYKEGGWDWESCLTLVESSGPRVGDTVVVVCDDGNARNLVGVVVYKNRTNPIGPYSSFRIVSRTEEFEKAHGQVTEWSIYDDGLLIIARAPQVATTDELIERFTKIVKANTCEEQRQTISNALDALKF